MVQKNGVLTHFVFFNTVSLFRFSLNFSQTMIAHSPKSHSTTACVFSFLFTAVFSVFLCDSVPSVSKVNGSLTYLWPLPSEFSSGNQTLSVDPALSLAAAGNGGNSAILRAAFDRYRRIIFKHSNGVSLFGRLRGRKLVYDISKLSIVVNSDDEDVSWV